MVALWGSAPVAMTVAVAVPATTSARPVAEARSRVRLRRARVAARREPAGEGVVGSVGGVGRGCAPMVKGPLNGGCVAVGSPGGGPRGGTAGVRAGRGAGSGPLVVRGGLGADPRGDAGVTVARRGGLWNLSPLVWGSFGDVGCGASGWDAVGQECGGRVGQVYCVE